MLAMDACTLLYMFVAKSGVPTINVISRIAPASEQHEKTATSTLLGEGAAAKATSQHLFF